MKKYVQVGCGHRGIFAYAKPIVKNYADHAALVGVYDVNCARAALVSEIVGCEIPVYDDFDRMLDEAKPDVVIVTSKDSTHDTYAIRAMKHGCDVIVEKPMTTTPEKCEAIRQTQKETGRRVTVTFNLRYHPLFMKLKEMIMAGAIGDIYSVHYEWMLNTDHGADYFRRWHRERDNSGSLMVHKSTHHFDIINWLLGEDPIAVNAFGTRRFYGHTRDERGERCLTCPYAKTCEYYFDISAGSHKQLYLDCEKEDGYYRDRCIFADEIDIEDTVSVNVKYSGGAVMSYSLVAHSPYEGLRMILNGSLGRMEVNYTLRAKDKPALGAEADMIRIYDRHGCVACHSIPMWSEAGHGGADDHMRDHIFGLPIPDPLGSAADIRAGMMSIGIGMAANISMKEGRAVELKEFYGDLLGDGQ